MVPREDYFICKHCLRGHVVKIPADLYSDTHWICPECHSTYTLNRYPVATEEAVRLAEHRKDKEDAEKYRALLAGLASDHKASLGKETGVWDSRNVGQ